jgi:hypothetical protein
MVRLGLRNQIAWRALPKEVKKCVRADHTLTLAILGYDKDGKE